MSKKVKCCHNCSCCVYIGEGDYICDKGTPFIVMEDHCPSEFYGACNDPKLYKQAQELTEDCNDTELSDTHQKNDINKKEDIYMRSDEIRTHVFNLMEQAKDSPDHLREILGQCTCDSGCPRYSDDCVKSCAIARFLEDYISEQDPFTKKVKYNQLKAVVGSTIFELVKQQEE